METTQASTPPSFETVWAALQELTASKKETYNRIDRLMEETARQIKETDRILKENAMEANRRIGHLDNLFGEVAEYMIAPNLREKFIEFGLKFPKTTQSVSVNDKDNGIFMEIDVMLENGEKAMLVEIKNKLTNDRIKGHIERLERMRKYADLRGDKRTFLGAVAGVVVTEEARSYALNQGFYLVEPSGESFSITPPNEPKEW